MARIRVHIRDWQVCDRMGQEKIYDRLTRVFRNVFDDDSLVPTATMTAADVQDWDSVNHITLIVAVEEEFGVKFKTAEIEKMKNVGQMVDVLQAKV
jgi:acyl carrier protein